VKPDLDTLVTVPDDPPAAGADRALDPPPADSGAPAEWPLEAGCVAKAEEADARPTDNPIIGTNIAVAMMLRHFCFVSIRRTFGLRSFSALALAADQAAEGGDTVPASPERPAIGDSDAVLDAGRSRSVSWGLESFSFMVSLL
jgi:hypothetical protein